MIPCRSGNRGARGPLASRNPNAGNNSKPIGFQNRFDALDKRKNNRGSEHKNDFQKVNQQNPSTRFFSNELFHSTINSFAPPSIYD